MHIILWIFLGITTGVIATILDDHPTVGGLIGAMVCGGLGALFGGVTALFLFPQFLIQNPSSLLLIGMGCSLLIIFIGKLANKGASQKESLPRTAKTPRYQQ